MGLNSHKAAEPRATRTSRSLAGKGKLREAECPDHEEIVQYSFSKVSASRRAIRLWNTVRESVLRASRRPSFCGFAQLGQRRQASPWPPAWAAAERPAIVVLRQSQRSRRHAARLSATAQCCLTPRSSGAPTAGHQRPAGGTRYIFTVRALASCRCRPLSSNVRHQKTRPLRSVPERGTIRG